MDGSLSLRRTGYSSGQAFSPSVLVTSSERRTMSAQGRDFSSFQGPITAAELKGLSFAATRVSNWSNNYMTMGVDVDFASDWKALEHIHRMAYWYFRPETDPSIQAEFFIHEVRSAGLRDGDMLVNDSETLTANVDAASHEFNAKVTEMVGSHNPVMI